MASVAPELPQPPAVANEGLTDQVATGPPEDQLAEMKVRMEAEQAVRDSCFPRASAAATAAQHAIHAFQCGKLAEAGPRSLCRCCCQCWHPNDPRLSLSLPKWEEGCSRLEDDRVGNGQARCWPRAPRTWRHCSHKCRPGRGPGTSGPRRSYRPASSSTPVQNSFIASWRPASFSGSTAWRRPAAGRSPARSTCWACWPSALSYRATRSAGRQKAMLGLCWCARSWPVQPSTS